MQEEKALFMGRLFLLPLFKKMGMGHGVGMNREYGWP